MTALAVIAAITLLVAAVLAGERLVRRGNAELDDVLSRAIGTDEQRPNIRVVYTSEHDDLNCRICRAGLDRRGEW